MVKCLFSFIVIAFFSMTAGAVDGENFEIGDVRIGNKSWKGRERNQGEIGSCVAFAVAHCLEFKYGEEMSAASLYLLAKKEWSSEEIHGASVKNMMKFAKETGTYHEMVVDDYNFVKHVTGEGRLNPKSDLSHLINQVRLQQNPTKYKFNSFLSLGNNVDNIRNALQQKNKPIVVADDGHAVACYGFRNGKFLCKNSWGSGNGRYYEIPYDQITEAYSWE